VEETEAGESTASCAGSVVALGEEFMMAWTASTGIAAGPKSLTTLGLGFGRGRGMGLGAVGGSAIGRASGTLSDPTGGVVPRIGVDDCAS